MNHNDYKAVFNQLSSVPGLQHKFAQSSALDELLHSHSSLGSMGIQPEPLVSASSYARQLNPNQNSFDTPPDEWQRIAELIQRLYPSAR
jgi:hypothetical protein